MIDRLEAMRELHRSGWTLQRIGTAFELSRERIRQILSEAGVTKGDGGRTVITISRRRQLRCGLSEARERRALRTYGCSHAKAVELNDGRNVSDSSGRAHIYRRQRQNAKTRRIGWKLTFPEWRQMWDESGRWEERGRGLGKYCMARQADSGPYSVANCYICQNLENILDGYQVRMPRDELNLSPKMREAHDLFVSGESNGGVSLAMGISRGTAAQYRAMLKRFTQEQVSP